MDKKYHISTSLVHLALTYYQHSGFVLFDAPMLVCDEVLKATLPQGRNIKLHNNDLYYVGSAEQSYLQMIKDGIDIPDKICMITPCQRDEEILDDTHLEIFLKIELISKYVDHLSVTNVINNAYKFFDANTNKSIGVVKYDDVIDIEIDGIEVGSYGTRELYGHKYVYGTGLALPRFSKFYNK